MKGTTSCNLPTLAIKRPQVLMKPFFDCGYHKNNCTAAKV